MSTQAHLNQSRTKTLLSVSSLTSRGVQLLTTQLPHHPPKVHIHLALFRDVKNAAALRDKLRAGDAAFEYAFVDIRTLLSTTHLLAAIFRAVNDATKGRLRTHNVHAEVVLCLNASNNIGDSFRRFGLNETTTALAVAKVSGLGGGAGYSAKNVADHLGDIVVGESLPFSDSSISPIHNLGLIKKVYKVNLESNNQGLGQNAEADSESEASRLESIVVGLMALRGG